MSWVIDIDPPSEPPERTPGTHSQRSPQQQLESESSPPTDNSSNIENEKIPSAKKIRLATLEGLRIGILPKYQDYGIVLEFLVNQFIKNDYKFEKIQRSIPWLESWLMNSFNEKLLYEELELAAQLEASRIEGHIKFILQGGFLSRTCGRFCSVVCCCLPLVAIQCRVCTYFCDLCFACLWGALCDWWLGAFCRRYILFYLCYFPKYIQLKIENLMLGESAWDDEELSIRNIYDSNSYRIANQFACLLFLAILLMLVGVCMVTVSYIYLPMHPDKLFMKAESVLGMLLLASGCCGLQFYCRCTL